MKCCWRSGVLISNSSISFGMASARPRMIQALPRGSTLRRTASHSSSVFGSVMEALLVLRHDSNMVRAGELHDQPDIILQHQSARFARPVHIDLVAVEHDMAGEPRCR